MSSLFVAAGSGEAALRMGASRSHPPIIAKNLDEKEPQRKRRPEDRLSLSNAPEVEAGRPHGQGHIIRTISKVGRVYCQMPNRFSAQELVGIPATLSAPRFETYLTACNRDVSAALRLYHWNAQICSAFLFPLHIFEICFRNPAANVIESYYNSAWPLSNAFRLSLPDSQRPHFSPRRELERAARHNPTTGKVIADLKFAFWVSMYTSRHQDRLWTPLMAREFPNLPPEMSMRTARQKIHDAADRLRELRNRIAHHEPIFRCDLVSDYTSILKIVTYRCALTGAWMNRSQHVTNLLTLRP